MKLQLFYRRQRQKELLLKKTSFDLLSHFIGKLTLTIKNCFAVRMLFIHLWLYAEARHRHSVASTTVLANMLLNYYILHEYCMADISSRKR